MLTVHEAFEKLRKVGVTDSIQMVRKWIRDGEIKAIPPEKGNRKEGYRIDPLEFERFIAKRNPLYNENKQLKKEIEQLKKEIQQLKQLNSQKKDENNEEPNKPDEPREEQKKSTAKGTNKLKTLTQIELNVFWHMLNLNYKKIDPNLEFYLRMDGVKKRFYSVILNSETKKENGRFVCPLTKKEFCDWKEFCLEVFLTIVEDTRKRHFQWVKENS